MQRIKLGATTSTNDYLKALDAEVDVADYMVVTAEFQTAGRGQMGAKWESKQGENLMFSVLARNAVAEASAIFGLNVAVTSALASALSRFGLPDIRIKWPNDILSGNYKLAGILIENGFKPDGGITSVIGVGLNVNQTRFDGLSQASSMRLQTGTLFDRDEVLSAVVGEIERHLDTLRNGDASAWETYRQLLFRKDIPSAFELPDGTRFMGCIRGVEDNGKLEVLLEDETVKSFVIKEVKLLY